MTHQRGWELFFLTGLPEAYLATRDASPPTEPPHRWEKSRTAFSLTAQKPENPE